MSPDTIVFVELALPSAAIFHPNQRRIVRDHLEMRYKRTFKFPPRKSLHYHRDIVNTSFHRAVFPKVSFARGVNFRAKLTRVLRHTFSLGQKEGNPATGNPRNFHDQ